LRFLIIETDKSVSTMSIALSEFNLYKLDMLLLLSSSLFFRSATADQRSIDERSGVGQREVKIVEAIEEHNKFTMIEITQSIGIRALIV